jgi:predicted glycoside hydrolase/deacetylase ChbG (UPF0249 family)
MVHVASTPDQKRLVINADDLGISRGVNTGIMEAARAGVVTSASMLVNLPGFANALDRAASCAPLSIGLHLNLTLGRPLSKASSLTRPDTGEFYPLAVLITKASLGRLDAEDIAGECKAQIDRMTDAGFPPTHLDSHRHIHAHPAIFGAVRDAAASRGLSRIRVPCEPLRVNAGDWRATLKKAGLLIAARSTREMTDGGSTDHFFGLSLQGGQHFTSRLFHLIPRLPEGTSELMVHPGYADSSLARQDSYTKERETELAALCSRDFRALIARFAVTLTSFGELLAAEPREDQLAQHH